MVLNTSLNIKGQPIVNDYHDGIEFEKEVWCESMLNIYISTSNQYHGCLKPLPICSISFGHDNRR